MWQLPDRRVWFFLAPVLPIVAAFSLSSPHETTGRIIEAVLYAWCIVLGSGIGILSIREGYSLLHPSVTASDSPLLYWGEVLIGCFLFAGIAAWQTVKVLSNAL